MIADTIASLCDTPQRIVLRLLGGSTIVGEADSHDETSVTLLTAPSTYAEVPFTAIAAIEWGNVI